MESRETVRARLSFSVSIRFRSGADSPGVCRAHCGGGTSYAYDADGNRVGVTAGGATTGYVVDTSLPFASVVEEYASSTLAARYDYGDDLIRMDRGSGVYYYLYDGLGSTRQLVNTGGAVTDGYSYDAFGEGLSHGPSSGVVNPFLFNAQQYDAASGDYFLRARYYDPSNGRFLSQDPFGGNDQDPISLHRYLYVRDDPANDSDPGGQESLGEVLTVSTIQTSLNGLRLGTIFKVYNIASSFADAVNIYNNYQASGQVDYEALGFLSLDLLTLGSTPKASLAKNFALDFIGKAPRFLAGKVANATELGELKDILVSS